MGFRVIVEFHNAGPHTIWAKLAEKLGREPTKAEAADEVRRILSDCNCAAEIAKRERLNEPAWKKRRRNPTP